MSKKTLYPHQEKSIELLRERLRSGCKRPVLMAPTGFGKTVLASAVINMALEKGKRVCFVVPAISLVDQTVQSFWVDGITEIGVIQSNHHLTDWSKPVQVASIQTIARKTYPEADLVIVDECHKVFKAQVDWIQHEDWQKVPFIGMSATPWTKGLGKIYDDLIISSTTAELIEAGFLSKFRVFAPSHPDLTGVTTVAGDYHEGQLAEAMNKAPLVADVVETWLRQGEGRPTLCFGVDCAHAKHMQRQFAEAGIPCGYIDAYTEIFDRNIVRDQLKRGEIKVVCNVGCLTTGVDWDVRCIILARPTKSEMLFVQIIGRGLRTADGKDNCLILDHSDTHTRLGFVTDIFHETLDMGKKAEKAKEKPDKLPKECPKCHYLRPVGVRICPNCGHMVGLPPGAEHVEGELAEITPRKTKKDEVPKGFVRFGDKTISHKEFYAQLNTYRNSRGYKVGWSAMKFKEATGIYPQSSWENSVAGTTLEVKSWIRSRQIAFAKRRDRDDLPKYP